MKVDREGFRFIASGRVINNAAKDDIDKQSLFCYVFGRWYIMNEVKKASRRIIRVGG